MLTELMLTELGATDSAVLMLLPLRSETVRLWNSVFSLGSRLPVALAVCKP